MIAHVHSAACVGIEAHPIEVEVDVSHGLPQFNVVGLPDASVREAKDRVQSAIKNSGYSFPHEKITINLAPADIKKEGSSYDLPIALGILAATEVIPSHRLSQFLFLGELALDGQLRTFKGAIVVANCFKRKLPLVFPLANAKEASLEKEASIYGVTTLREIVEFLQNEIVLQPLPATPYDHRTNLMHELDFSEVKGQIFAKRAIEIAIAGGHNILFIGPPGSGKTMLARRIPTILPDLNFQESLQITKIYSVAGHNRDNIKLIRHRPFRTPHSSISCPALIGGGSWPKPGEVSLAHGGVLFLDEFPEFRKDVLEALRTPLEDGEVTISRAKSQLSFPANFMLVTAMNPCPCGFLSDPRRRCRCSMIQIRKYQSKVSGPILDRIDIHIEVPSLSYKHLTQSEPAESSEKIRRRIRACRGIQQLRFENKKISLNTDMKPKDIKLFSSPTKEGSVMLERAMKSLNLSARAYYKILKIARTIADLEQVERVCTRHIGEAIQYRTLDRQWWQ